MLSVLGAWLGARRSRCRTNGARQDGATASPGFGSLRRRSLAIAGAGVAGMALTRWMQPARALTNTHEIADMTWMELRDAVSAGARIAIVPSGGLEQNGPHMVIGKHDYIVAWAARRIAAELGNALVTPVISYVPQGDYDPPTGNMVFPGSIGIPPAAFAAVLEGIARSLKRAGFETICFIADHGLSIAPQTEVARLLSAEWGDKGPKVAAINAYYAEAAENAYLKAAGETDAAIGQHATIADTSELMAVHPDGVDLARLPAHALVAATLGVDGDPRRASIARGEDMMRLKVNAAVAEIRALVENRAG